MKYILFTLGVLLSIQSSAQSILISGKVMDSLQHLPLEGALIAVVDAKGTTLQAVATSKEGEFSMQANARLASSLSISFIGYRQRSIPFPYNKGLKAYHLGTLFLHPQ